MKGAIETTLVPTWLWYLRLEFYSESGKWNHEPKWPLSPCAGSSVILCQPDEPNLWEQLKLTTCWRDKSEPEYLDRYIVRKIEFWLAGPGIKLPFIIMALWENAWNSKQPALKGTWRSHTGSVCPDAWPTEALGPWLARTGSSTEGVKVSSEPSVAQFPNHQVVLRSKWGLVPGRRGGLVSKDKKENLAFSIPKRVAPGDVWARVAWSRVESCPFSELFRPGSALSLSVAVGVFCYLFSNI